MGKIVIIHFQPLELYPPIMNFINCGKGSSDQWQVDVFTTYCYSDIEPYVSPANGIKIHRLGARSKKTSAMGRALHYLHFYVLSLCRIIAIRPSVVFYFETFSAFPAYVYKRFINVRCRLFIHYHEYMTSEEYEHGMWLIRWFHRLEKKIYSTAEWISHTNEARMERFITDLGGIQGLRTHTLPNFPPAAWAKGRKRDLQHPVKMVYVGSCSLDTMYTKVFSEWILDQQGKFTWDIYSLNMTSDAREYLNSLPGDMVKVHGGVSYRELPAILADYDIGVILYTGHIPNWVDNAPNKLFEYFACGLDVWLPFQMTGSRPYLTAGTYPKVLAVDFQNIRRFDVTSALAKTGMAFQPSGYFCEEIYRPLWAEMTAKNN